MDSTSRRLVPALAALLAFSLGQTGARAQLLFSDSFRYASGPLDGNGPPAGAPPGQTGWSSTIGDPHVDGPGLDFTRVFARGRATYLSGSDSDAAFAKLPTINSGIVWIGFLMNLPSGHPRFGYADLHLGGFTSYPIAFGLIYDRGFLGIDNDVGGPGSQAFTHFSPNARSAWLVVKLDFDRGTESLFANPTVSEEPRIPDAELDMLPDFKAAGFNEVSLVCGANDAIWGFDEVRIGRTYGDVRTQP